MKPKKKTIWIISITVCLFVLLCTIGTIYLYDRIISNLGIMNLKNRVIRDSNTGLTLVNEGKMEEGLEYLEKALDDAIALDKIESTYWQETSQFLLSDAYNNMGYANLLMGDITLSLEYLNQALRIEPNYSYEFTNKASALSSQYEYEEALTYYDLALAEDENESYAYYGKGEVYYNQGNYDKAIREFKTYQQYEPNDIDAIWYLTYCYFNLKDTDLALKFLDKSIKENKEASELYLAKADLYEQAKSYEEAKNYSENIAELFKGNIEVQLNLGEFYFDQAEYQNALEHFSKIREDFPDNVDIDSWIIACYREENKLEEAVDYLAKRLAKGTATGQLFMDLGDAYTSVTLFMEAIPYFEEALRIDPELEDAAVNIIYSLYSANRFVRGIEYGEQAETKYADNYDIPYYIGDCYYSIGEYEKAANAYLRALELSPQNDDLMALIGECYLVMEDYSKAERYTLDALELDYYDETAMNTKELLNIRKLPINEQIRQLYEDNYLYYDEDKQQKKLKEVFSEEDMTAYDIAVAIDRMRLPDDIFTFTLYDEYYTSFYTEAQEDVEYKRMGDINYIRFYSFGQYTDSKVIQILDSIQNSEEEILTLDLRGNGGGLLSGAVNILDVLLPECTICTDFDREGYNESYYSDASQIKFKKIYILVDENSASASELVTLSLKSYLSNVTILGRNTFGKGVGQIAYEDKSRNLVVFLVTSYWNVREHNIMGSNIMPDIYMESDELRDYLAIINE